MGREKDPTGMPGIKEVANYLSLSVSSIYKMLSSGELPGHKVGKYWRFRWPAIDAWVDAKGNQPLDLKPSGLTARSLDASHPTAMAVSERPPRTELTPEQRGLLKGMWVDRDDQFIAIAKQSGGRASLSRLLGISPQDVDEIAKALSESLESGQGRADQ
jgi:excisionase family DNA binding protein